MTKISDEKLDDKALKLIRQIHSYQYKVVDERWGIRYETGNSYHTRMTVNLLEKELELVYEEISRRNKKKYKKELEELEERKRNIIYAHNHRNSN